MLKKTSNIAFVLISTCLILYDFKCSRASKWGIIHGHSWSEFFDYLPLMLIKDFLLSFLLIIFWDNMKKAILSNEKKAKQRLLDKERFHSLVQTHECRVCGYCLEEFPWGEDGKQPSYQICPCCGVQFGKEDITPEDIKQYRAVWKKRGYKWFDKAMKPDNWDLNEQLKKAPKSWINNL